MRNILIKKYKEDITNEYNHNWNISLRKYLNIKLKNIISNHNYINFYYENKIVLLSSYLDYDHKPHYFFSYRGMTKTNFNLISLLKNQNDTQEDGHEDEQRKNTKDKAGDEEYYDLEEDEKTNHIPNPNHYKYKNENNCIEVYTGRASNLRTIDIHYAFICCGLFIECFKTSSLRTITKNIFDFHYQYNDKLKASKLFKRLWF